ncbi:hypothetical protein BpHYR1_003344 [Brachionus plicatilis]|uniref:Uncharacterized protein n=1 Tax=Brachionus plicatilis TaxID=10195 RepID=A0A3M7R9X3_BRAPC|nr:hypothetical protein BpHYR1_003344 [Brachionus plicatilis]
MKFISKINKNILYNICIYDITNNCICRYFILINKNIASCSLFGVKHVAYYLYSMYIVDGKDAVWILDSQWLWNPIFAKYAIML